MRSKNAFKNLVTSLGYEVFVFALEMILPIAVISAYGNEVNGLTQTINRLLSLVQLLQAGAVGASIREMYKPVADKDYETQSAIMYSSRKFFRTTGLLYLLISFACSIFYGFYLQKDGLTMWETVLSFVILAVNGSLYFFYTTKHDIVCSTYQKKYLMTRASYVEKALYYALMFAVVFLNLHFLFMYVAMLLCGIARVVLNEVSYRKLAAGNLKKDPENKTYQIRDRKYLMLSSIGSEMITAAPTVIITTFVGLTASSVFSIYARVYVAIQMIVNALHLAVSAIFGNLVASSDDTKIARVFNILVYMFTMLGALLTSCVAFLFMPFIKLYVGMIKDNPGEENVNYVYPLLAIFITVYVAVFAIKTVYAFVSTVYGMFKLTCKITLSCGLVGVLISVLCVIFFGMPYVMVGVLFFHLASAVILLLAFKKEIPWIRFNKLFPRVALIVLVGTVSYLLYASGLVSIASWLGWVLAAVVYALCVCAVLLIYTAIFEKKEFVALLGYAKAILKKEKKTQV